MLAAPLKGFDWEAEVVPGGSVGTLRTSGTIWARDSEDAANRVRKYLDSSFNSVRSYTLSPKVGLETDLPKLPVAPATRVPTPFKLDEQSYIEEALEWNVKPCTYKVGDFK